MIDLPAHGAVCGLCKESLSPLYQVRDRWLCLDCFRAFHDLMESYQDWDAVLKQARERKDARRAVVPDKRVCQNRNILGIQCHMEEGHSEKHKALDTTGKSPFTWE